jgi:hypothetical protein
MTWTMSKSRPIPGDISKSSLRRGDPEFWLGTADVCMAAVLHLVKVVAAHWQSSVLHLERSYSQKPCPHSSFVPCISAEELFVACSSKSLD